MASWWQKPYAGAPPPADLPPLPRPLYPPSAANKGKERSKPGPDVEAVKRAISRGGRWPWQTFDREYSDAFALGDPSSELERSGVAGFQRQMGISPDSGWIGEQTYNALAYSLVPEGRPHTGEHLFDSTAIRLLNDAYDIYKEKPAGPLKRVAIPSPNYSSRNADVRLIVIHTAEGALTYQSLGSFFASPSSGVSSHTGIDDTPGTIGEYVKRGSKAWTAANANPVAVQTELCAFAKWSTSEWNKHPVMLENCARWIAEEADYFDIPITKLTAQQAQGTGRGVCQHNDLGSWGGGHWDCGTGFPIDTVLEMARGNL